MKQLLFVFLLLLGELTEEGVAVTKFRLAGSDLCPNAHISIEKDARDRAECAAECGENSCVGFCFSTRDRKCKLATVDLGIALRDAQPSLGYDMIWSGYGEGFTRFGNKSYKHFDSPLDHYSARVACWALNATMVLPTNDAENAYIHSLYTHEMIWILLDDVDGEGIWKNTDTREVHTYEKFNINEPNGWTGENCVSMLNTGYWIDIACGGWYLHYVCEIPMKLCDEGIYDIRCTYTQ